HSRSSGIAGSVTATSRMDRAARRSSRFRIRISIPPSSSQPPSYSYQGEMPMNTLKKYTTLILVGIIVLLAAMLTGVLVFMKNQPVENRTFQPLVEIAPMEPDSEKWGVNFPN